MYKQDDRVLPAYAGLATFLRSPAVSLDEVVEGLRVVVGVPFDGGCGSRPGARFGPHAIRYSSLHLHYYASSSPDPVMVDLETGERFDPGVGAGSARGAAAGSAPAAGGLADYGDVSVYPSSPERTAASVEDALRRLAGRGAVPLVLGGDHYVTYPTVRGVVAGLADRLGLRPEEVRLGYVHVDGHFDLGSDNAIYGRHFHGTTARLVSELPSVGLGRMAWLGQRGFVRREQWEFVRRENLRYWTAADIRRRGPAEAAREALEFVAGAPAGEPGVHGLYVTIDIDVVDVTEAPGTGAIHFGGLTASEFLALVSGLRDERVVALDLVEVAPPYDPSERTARLAALALVRFLAGP